jgi:hypothetical protein
LSVRDDIAHCSILTLTGTFWLMSVNQLTRA